MTQTNPRIAQPGDIFILLVPTAQELHLIKQWQLMLQERYGGHVVPNPHITCQRFSRRIGQSRGACIDHLTSDLCVINSFQLYTDRLIQFFAPYWGTRVLRWRIQETADYANFRGFLKAILETLNCPSHFNRRRNASCTALNLEGTSDLEIHPSGVVYPAPLFTAKEVWISELDGNRDFSVLETIQLKDT